MTPVEFPGFGNPTMLIQVVHVRGIWLSSTQILSVLFRQFFVSLKLFQNKSLEKK